LTDFVRRLDPDVVVMQHWGLMRELERCAAPLALDLAGPHLLERLYWKTPDPDRDVLEKTDALARADFVVCSGRWQRHYFLPWLRMAGWDITAPGICPVIPFSFAPRLPETPATRAFETFVYGGVFLPWQDPEPAMRAVLAAMDEAGRGRLRIYGGPHPDGDVSGGRFEGLWKELSGHPRVVGHGLQPFDALLADYATCGVALDLMSRNPERELAFTTRTVVYMACGLPVVYNDYSELSEPIREFEAGWTLDPARPEDLESLVRALLADPSEIARRGANARRLVAERMNWERTIEPLAAFCASPQLRLDKETARLRRESLPRRVAELERERDGLIAQIQTLRGKWFFRLYERRARWSWLLIPLLAPAMAVMAGVVGVGMLLTRAPRKGLSE
jgi:glycosyltransferase involved in cell wall biosynthesis